MKQLILSFLAALILSACGNNSTDMPGEAAGKTTKTNKLTQLSWLLGTWQNQTPDGLFTEHWKTSEQVYSGHGLLVSADGDTLFSEHIKLEELNNTLYYKPVVSGQNDGKETVFKERTFSADEIVFENPAHDFPQRIIYKRSSDSTLYARIEGTVNGKEMKEEYEYKKTITPSAP